MRVQTENTRSLLGYTGFLVRHAFMDSTHPTTGLCFLYWDFESLAMDLSPALLTYAEYFDSTISGALLLTIGSCLFFWLSSSHVWSSGLCSLAFG
ncbi:hypothetical protein FA15DRAFT_666199 [Coprinopsis marcescibilis]|uniref:Uncharacterized protein n=1 Tax=Coprinopsis marcescibilis TaxID=230819 RepID=A0A5C3LGS7_COPMA|nr:hypothetical protein FA15DRAFT_666199 [Coprinopsis marcescibilis]